MKIQATNNRTTSMLKLAGPWIVAVVFLTQPLLGQDGTLPEEIEKRIASTVREAGTIQSASHFEVRSEVPGNRAILQIVPEGMRLKTGDRILQLDDSDLAGQLTEKQIELAKAESEVVVAEINLVQTRNSRDKLAKLIELQQKAFESKNSLILGANGEIMLEKKELANHKQLLERRIQILRKRQQGIATENREDSEGLLQLEMEMIETESELAHTERRLAFMDDLYLPSKSLELELETAQAVYELDSQMGELARQLAIYESDLSVAKQKLQSAGREMSNAEDSLERCTILAPIDGTVVYATERSRSGVDWIPEVGALVRQRQPIVLLTDFKKLEVKTLINESRIASIRTGQDVKLTVDALPNLKIQGVVRQVSQIPEPSSWIQGESVKEYAAIVSILDPPDSLRVGMTVLVEITIPQTP